MRSALTRLAAALAVLLMAVPASMAEARAPQARFKVTTERTAQAILERGGLTLRVRFRGAGRVRLLSRAPRRDGRGVSFTRRRVVRFARAGRRRARLRLTRRGRSIVERRHSECRRLRVNVRARARLRGSRRWRRTIKVIRLRPGNFCGPGPSPPGPFTAGAAGADITPPIGTPMFAYTARSQFDDPEELLQVIADPDPDQNLYAKTFVPSEGIHTRVRARAIVIEQFGRKFALVQTDLGGLPFALVQEVLGRVADLGITGERLLLSATHTHSSTGPIWPADSQGYALVGGDAFDPRAFETTIQGIVEAIRAADARLEPARIGTGVADVDDASRNRAFEAFRLNPDVPANEAAARATSIDPEVTVIRVDSADGRPIAAWSNFAVHPTSFGDENLLFSGDNAATAERVVERAGPPVNVWTNSNEGDISPNGGPDRDGADELQYVPNSFASANLVGARVGAGVLRAWREAAAEMNDEIPLDARRTFLFFDGTQADGEPVGPLAVLGNGGIVAPDQTCAPFDNFAGPGQGRKFPLLAGAGFVPSVHPVAVWRVGSLGLVGLPSEMTRQMGKRIRDQLSASSRGAVRRFALAGLTNGYVSYTATPEEYDWCGYEGSFTLFGRRQGPRWLDVAGDALTALLRGLPAAGAGEPPALGFGSPDPTPVDETPNAGQVVAQPAAQVRRYGRATFSWRGGDSAVDAPRGKDFVSLQRLQGGGWTTVGTDDSESDITVLGDDGAWTETWQFGPCDRLGTYRFLVRGVADMGSGPAPYEVASAPFELERTAPLAAGSPVVTGGQVHVTATYPDPGEDALLALPRRVRSGEARLSVNGQPVDAPIDNARLRFTAPAPPGASVSVLDIEDGCGNDGP